jgi:hypothetical protein
VGKALVETMFDKDRPPEGLLINGEDGPVANDDARHRYPTPISPTRTQHNHEPLKTLVNPAPASPRNSERSREEQELPVYKQSNAMEENTEYQKAGSELAQTLFYRPDAIQVPVQSFTNQDGRQSMPNGTMANGEQRLLSESHKRKQSRVEAIDHGADGTEKLLKLSPEKLHVLISDPESVPSLVAQEPPAYMVSIRPESPRKESKASPPGGYEEKPASRLSIDTSSETLRPPVSPGTSLASTSYTGSLRPSIPSRALSTPSTSRAQQNLQRSENNKPSTARKTSDAPGMLRFDSHSQGLKASLASPALASPLPASIPLPPLSIPTYLQLELSSHRPSPLYIHRSATTDFPYESSKVKIERLLNFIWLLPQLESVLWFGTLACFDSWLYTFTILPLRLVRSFYVLSQSWAMNLISEFHFVSGFVYSGSGRMWRRRRMRGNSIAPVTSDRSWAAPTQASQNDDAREKPKSSRHHRRAKSVPSALLPDDKADMLKGLLIICTCVILLRLDASKMYHWIRGQAAIKLYVIYNVLEVCDRLFSALGQDVLECLFSREALERKSDGHSKILRPLCLFVLALVYTVTHATSLFYQVITLNVAVNSYSNALITLLISNQFVEIKSTVFKKFEKENLFQLTCADVVERFQLWLMLTIIASRNIVETGGLNAGFSIPTFATSGPSSTPSPNSSNPLTQAMPPRSSSSILPSSFTLLPALVSSLTAYAPAVGHVLGPFLVVLGSEMFVDWLKHAYIGKFNNVRPAIYGRFLDVLAKDYYTNAFGDQNLTKRLGLPVIPLSCLFIRAGVQTYHMFIAAWVPSPLPSAATGLTSVHAHYATSRASQPTSTTAALSQRFDNLLKQMPEAITSSPAYRHFNTILIFALGFLVLLAVKLVLGILLLSFARSRYRSMKERERQPLHHVEGGRRVGGWGVVEVDSDKRRWIYDDDAAGLQALQEREERDKGRREKGGAGDTFDKVKRYEMVAKRIW